MTIQNTGRFAIFRQLMTDGIDCMFGNPGVSEENLVDAMASPEFKDFKYYLAFQEGTAVAMGDAYARASLPFAQVGEQRAWRRPAVVQLHSYAGLANGLGMMYYARRGNTPMVVIAGESGIKYDAMDGQMGADLTAMARPFVKSDYNGPCAWRVVDPGSLLRLLRRAIKTAATPPYGPVFLTLPMDILDLPNTEEIARTLPVQSDVKPDAAVIAETAQLLSNAANPLILMGDGIAASHAQAELTEVAELLGAPVWGGNCSEVNMPTSHPLFAGYLGHVFGSENAPIISKADVVLISGTTVLPEVFPSLSGVFAPDAKVIQFDLNSTEIGKNFPLTISALADPKEAFGLLANALRSTLTNEQKERAANRRQEYEATKRAERENELLEDARTFEDVPMQAPLFMKELNQRLEKLSEPALIFDEALTNSPALLRYLPQDKLGTYFQTRAGMLGTGLPGTLGLKVAHPDRVVFGFSGDGGSISTIQALATAARFNIGAKFVVCNNRSYRILKSSMRHYWSDHGEPQDQEFPASYDLTKPEFRFDKLAQGQGVNAVRVERPEEIAPALDKALADDRPFLIDLVLSGDL
ncbi:MAG: thiamine pyrophosphate-binding protein [Alphaproteobacteria bacterium]